MNQEKLISNLQLLQLHPEDNVAVMMQSGIEGEMVVLGDIVLNLPSDLSMGHKLAITPILKGADITKYGAPIGMASTDISFGDHVHLHNVESRYTIIEDLEEGQI